MGKKHPVRPAPALAAYVAVSLAFWSGVASADSGHHSNDPAAVPIPGAQIPVPLQPSEAALHSSPAGVNPAATAQTGAAPGQYAPSAVELPLTAAAPPEPAAAEIPFGDVVARNRLAQLEVLGVRPQPPAETTPPAKTGPAVQVASAEVSKVVLDTPSAQTKATASWVVRPNESLRQTLMEWAARVGWIVSWHVTTDFEPQVGNEFIGDFEEAVTALFNAFPASVAIRAELRVGNVPPLLVVTESRRPLQ